MTEHANIFDAIVAVSGACRAVAAAGFGAVAMWAAVQIAIRVIDQTTNDCFAISKANGREEDEEEAVDE